MSSNPPRNLSQTELRNLVMTAFERARARGSASWQTMTTAVLKNRLLQQTDGRFDERNYGFASMLELVSSMPDLLTVDPASQPRAVTIRADGEQTSSAALATMGPRARIREDLWNAVLDYSAGEPWVWDGARALPASEAATSQAPVLPTVTAVELRAWRESFLRDRLSIATGVDADIATEVLGARLGAWLESGAATARLPNDVKGPWNAELKRRVLQSLTGFFDEHGIAAPPDMVETSQSAPASGSPVGDIRAFVTACVAVMTEQELAVFPIPAGVAARVVGSR